MSQDVNVFVTTRRIADNRLELVLYEMDGGDRRWLKIYDGPLFLSMDAQSLSLVEPVPHAFSNGPKYQIKRSGKVPLELLSRMRFQEEQGRGSQGQ